MQLSKVRGRIDWNYSCEVGLLGIFLKDLNVGRKVWFVGWFYLLIMRTKGLFDVERLRLIELCICLNVRD